MSLSKQFKTDVENEVRGVEFQFGENEDKSIPSFNLSRMGKSNKRYTKMLDLKTKPHRRQMELGTMPPELAESIFMEIFAKTIMNGWSNICLSDVTGNEDDTGFAPFTPENAMSLFANLPELYDDLQEKAKSAANYREESLEQEAKN